MAHPTFDRSPWLLEPTVSFLNHGSFGACPEPVLEAQLDEVRQRVGAFLNADPEGIAFVPNATTAVSTVLASLRFQPGDELLAGDHEYNATLNALRLAADRDGATVVLCHIPFPIHDPAQAAEASLPAARSPGFGVFARTGFCSAK